MRLSEAWLREWVDPPIDTQTLTDQLSMAGLEVDALAPVAGEFTGVVIGRVLSVDPHPDAAKLRLCQVDAGQGAPLQIICGAANVAAGQQVPVAVIGARLPGDFKIKKAKLRGVESFGMICSASELGLAESSEGILVLPEHAPVGDDFRAWMGLDDHSIELDLTPDRGDCLSLAGVAREVGVINRLPLSGPTFDPVAPASDERWPLEISATDACPHYVCRLVRDIDSKAQTPLWMQERLRRCGLRPISPVVDVTNYVLLELGQPLHAFDAERLTGAVQVRLARDGEPLTLLNDEQIKLQPDTLVIADDSGAIALAGVMGGASTAVSESTRHILFESAFFTPQAVAGRARRYGLHTDASHRFERGVDPELQVRAIERATSLLLDIAGGTPGPVVAARSESELPQRPSISLRPDRIPRLLGIELQTTEVEDILTRLGLQLAPAADGWQVQVPGHRFDLRREADLIAELGRIYGYDRIPRSQSQSATRMSAPREADFDLDQARARLVGNGYFEAVTYSFISPAQQALIDPETQALALSNPISAELSVMRTSLWPGLLQTAQQNLARQQNRVRLFETGLRFRVEGEQGLLQEPMLAALGIGDVMPEQWGMAAQPVDFHHMKNDLHSLLALTGRAPEFSLVTGAHPALHPGQCARIERAGAELGWIGMLHPGVAKALDLPDATYLFELRLAGLADGAVPNFSPLSKFPSIRRDLALLVDRSTPCAAIEAAARAAGGDWLREALVFDVYAGEKIDSERKSVALGLILQASSQTLTDQDVETTVTRVLNRLKQDLGARLRS
ncbi:phenylalanine--tRNA ligase subunit beta [Thiorhodovibrio frisius]|uniref:Phenylalanine--tRNA ligase beta subunit n=1 Tax=Thiorhodovibrio frisius TaxID=631362 RepID=H8Z7T1_9GAMM|nr:phenylalanine--tRNA ligase subunit beta [Thiorhodovibrio frisius]EIC20943.1 phenylalanyl-tRNA synthetase, beta subunit [Thiorhodovibrio frisius]WPL22002.1 Phenylalanine--tRNA ligase beta subunit [Thiorhodovibrio frisius]